MYATLEKEIGRRKRKSSGRQVHRPSGIDEMTTFIMRLLESSSMLKLGYLPSAEDTRAAERED